MKLKPDKKYIHMGLTLFFTAIAIMLVFFFVYRHASIRAGIDTMNKILAPIIYGFILAYIMTPLLNFIEKNAVFPLYKKFKFFNNYSEKKQKKKARSLSIIATLIVVFAFLYFFFVNVIPEIYKSLQNIISHYSLYTNNLVRWLNKLMDDNPDIAKLFSQMIINYSSETDNWLNDFLLPTVSKLFPNITDIFLEFSESLLRFGKFLWNVVIGLIISIYVLSSKEKFSRSCTKLLYAFFENKTANKILEAVRFTHHKFIGFLSGKVVDSLIVGMISFIFLTILGMPYVLLVSMIIGVTNIIPFFGPWFGAVPSAIIILMVAPKKALIFIIYIVILQQIDGNVIGPKILSESTGLSSFWIICSITIFGGLFGVPGMIIGVPVTAVIFAGINSITNSKLEKKNMPVEEDNYFEVGQVSNEGEFTPYVYVEPPKQKPSKAFIKMINFVKKITINTKEKITKKKEN